MKSTAGGIQKQDPEDRRSSPRAVPTTRAQALANRRLARAGGDPLAEKRRLKSMPTFAAAEAILAQMRPGWRNSKHGKDWLSSMERFASPGSASCPSPR